MISSAQAYPKKTSNNVAKYAFCALLAAAVFWLIEQTVPYGKGIALVWDTIFHFNASNYQEIVVYFTYLPRLAIALLVGFALALSGAVMQLVLRNPIASPTTLGVAAGAEFGMAVAMLWMSAGAVYVQFMFAFAGGAVATLVVFLLSAKSGYSPINMILAGMVTSLFLGALNTMLLITFDQKLSGLFVWGSGSLNQTDWSGVQALLPTCIVLSMLLILMSRVMSTLKLGDGIASGVGVNTKIIRVATLTIAILLTSVVVSKVGIIGFIGIVAPNLVRMSGVRHTNKLLFYSGIVGAILLLIADLLVQSIAGIWPDMIPTGAMTAMIGAPFLLFILKRRQLLPEIKVKPSISLLPPRRSFVNVVLVLLAILVVSLLLALMLGKGQSGWDWMTSDAILNLRWPRVVGSMLAGIGLAIAGAIIQRIIANPMASPEILGISSGAALSLVLGSLMGITINRHEQLLSGTLGAVAVTAFILLISRKNRFSPLQMLLTGVALSAGLDALLRIVLASGQEKNQSLLTWMSGSTYLITPSEVTLLAGTVALLGLIAVSLHRTLDVFSLGYWSAGSLGVNGQRFSMLLLLIVALLTTVCTIVIGPLSFVGLLAPHLARSLGQYKARDQLITAAMIGAIVMVVADWLGRTLWYPWQFPAGLLASLVGGAYFLYRLSVNR
ncbi:Fe(3+)-hydroxamate ABC transporter permease FhuB [Vibrio sp. S4M6]|uniref:Fe(3+)-hydroxamate ABC transporter permease FhuB n=1 Tax=Vibrio sinus TaxID=2946865 RepID=UPI002029CBBF|nr:Fe(3+)-hydroxamate ABC transporter permease FhuB [Vibrio sinus]MCL9780395.1 Fe(3+)-hydroxamate ABC transporter permease FhuB [Vibrio sinus]